MKILVVGGGGREHAIIRALKKSPVLEHPQRRYLVCPWQRRHWLRCHLQKHLCNGCRRHGRLCQGRSL